MPGASGPAIAVGPGCSAADVAFLLGSAGGALLPGAATGAFGLFRLPSLGDRLGFSRFAWLGHLAWLGHGLGLRRLRWLGSSRGGCGQLGKRLASLAVVIPDTIASIAFGGIQSRIGPLDQRFGIVDFKDFGHADANRDLQFDLLERKAGFGDRHADALRGASGLGQIRDRQDESEFLAAEAGDQVHFAHRLCQDSADAAQHFVAGLMAMHVVEFLEMVDVENDQRKYAMAPLPFGHPPAQFVIESATIGERGQRVGAGHRNLRFQLGGLALELHFGRSELLLQPLVGLHDFGHAFEHELFLIGGTAGLGRSQFRIDLMHSAVMFAHVFGHARRQRTKRSNTAAARSASRLLSDEVTRPNHQPAASPMNIISTANNKSMHSIWSDKFNQDNMAITHIRQRYE